MTVLSPLAEGGDQLVAGEGLNVGARLVAPLPFARNLYAYDFADVAAEERFDALCARAHVIELPLLTGHSRSAVAASGEERDRQYAQVGMFVARHGHLLLAIWDGRSNGKLGGTAQIVDYFLTGAAPGGHGRARRPQLYGGGDERLLCHLVCSRDTPDGAPAAPLRPGEVIWRNREEASAPGAPMPPEFRTVFACADAFNVEAAKYAADIAREGTLIKDAPPNPGTVEVHLPESPAVLFRAADWLAIHFQRRVLLSMRVIYTVAFLTGVAFNAHDNLNHTDDMIFVFLLLFAIGVAISTIAKRRAWHRKYLDYRALAEGLRVQCHWRRAGISLTADPDFAHDSLLQKQDIELDWVRNVMRSAGLADDPAPIRPGATVLRGVIDDWVGDDQSGQLGYYGRNTGRRERSHRLNERLGRM
ncbi:MAG TPA: hypothetical protein VF284_06815 [Rhodanobacteraceae bacterium]